MSKQECAIMVRQILEKHGPQEASILASYCRAPQATVRAALKLLGASAREFGRWPRYQTDGSRIPARDGWRGNGTPNFMDRFTLWKLGEWSTCA